MKGSAAATFRVLAQIPHAEGVATGPDGTLWAGGEQGELYRIDPETGEWQQVAHTNCYLLGLCLDRAGRIYACAYDKDAVLRIEPTSGEVETYCAAAGGKPLRGVNWPVFAADGTLFVSCSGSEKLADCDGYLVQIPPGGGDGEIVETRHLHFVNGLALSPAGVLYAIESFSSRVLSICDAEIEVYASLPRTIPDGLALDDEGGLLVACFQPNQVVRIPPGGGDLEVLVDDWTGQELMTPTNMAFYGPELRSVAIASLCGWWVSAIDVPWRGQPLLYPELP